MEAFSSSSCINIFVIFLLLVALSVNHVRINGLFLVQYASDQCNHGDGHQYFVLADQYGVLCVICNFFNCTSKSRQHEYNFIFCCQLQYVTALRIFFIDVKPDPSIFVPVAVEQQKHASHYEVSRLVPD